MRIGIDARTLTHGIGGGIGRYLVNLLEQFKKIDKNNKYILYFNQRFQPSEETLKTFSNQYARVGEIWNDDFFQKRVIPAPWILYKHFLISYYLKKDKIDLFHSPTPTLPILKACRMIMTIHELSYEIYPEWFPWQERIYWMFKFGSWAAKKADRIIADSQSTKKDIQQVYKIPGTKIDTVYIGINDFFKPTDREKAKREVGEYGVRNKFILFVGAIFKKRNLPRLIEALSILRNKYGYSHQLVIVGNEIPSYHINLDQIIRSFNLEDYVLRLGQVSDSILRSLYNAAELFVYPSWYEGFGIPVLEAMACGCPVVTSNVSSLPEVVGDAGLLINPHSTEDLVKGIHRVLSDNKLRMKMIEKGIKKTRIFDWEKIAYAHLESYKKAMT